MSNPLQKTVDTFWDKTLFRIIPYQIKPNHFTFVRFFLVPFILYFLATQQMALSLWLFLVAALSDSIDGSLARKRNQISDTGIMLDPMADKLLIALLALFLIFYYPYIQLLLIIIVIDLIIGTETLALMIARQNISIPASNWTGKSKMVFQVLGISLALLYLISQSYILLTMSAVVFLIAIFTGVLSLFSYSLRSLRVLQESR
jgi:CDP-diacylglycerol--glycerol-3-phosphate 3-phosphatidyltransferase